MSEQEHAKRLSIRIWQGVTLQLFLVAILPLTVLVLLVTFGSLRLHHQAMRSLAADRNLLAVQSAAASLSQQISRYGQDLEFLAAGPDLGQDGGRLPEETWAGLATFDGGIATFTSDGHMLSQSGGAAIRALSSQPDWAEITAAAAAEQGRAVFSAPLPVGGQAYVPVVLILPDGAILAGLFSPAPVLEAGLAVLAAKEAVTVLVVDPHYRVLFQSGSLTPEEDLPSHPGIADALAGAGGIDYLPTAAGEHVIATSAIRPVGWALMIEETWEDISSPLLRATQNAPLIIIPILAFALLALWFGLRQIVQPLQALEGKASDLAGGDFSTIREPVGGVPEIRRLQETLAETAVRLQEAQNSLHSYIGAITDSVESERRNLARELHDQTLQSLIALGQYTQYALHWNEDPRVEKTLEQIMALSEDGMKSLRGMVRGLRPIYIEDLGLATALSMHASDRDHLEGIPVYFHQVGDERRLAPDIELALYRIAQEALNNIQRHSGAGSAWITLHFKPDEVVVEVRDDGTGFDVPADPLHFARRGHYGLLSLYERAELIGAALTIRSRQGEGTLIRVRLPASGA